MIQQFPHNDFVKQDLLNNLKDVLDEMKTNYNMFEKLLKSHPAKINAVLTLLVVTRIIDTRQNHFSCYFFLESL